jgi:hypothetical protein
LLALDLVILLWAGGVITGEVKVAQGSTCSGHDLLKLLLLVPKVVLLLVVALIAGVIPVVVVIVVLIGGVKFFLLGAVGDEVAGVATLEEAPRWSPPLLVELVKAWNFLTSRVISSSRILSYCSSETAAKEDKANSKADETVVLVGLASWPPKLY